MLGKYVDTCYRKAFNNARLSNVMMPIYIAIQQRHRRKYVTDLY